MSEVLATGDESRIKKDGIRSKEMKLSMKSDIDKDILLNKDEGRFLSDLCHHHSTEEKIDINSKANKTNAVPCKTLTEKLAKTNSSYTDFNQYNGHGSSWISTNSQKTQDITSNTFRNNPKGMPSISHQLYVASVLIFFAGSSLGAIFINKTCLTGYHFRYPFTLVLGQMFFSILILTVLHLTGYKKIPISSKSEILSLIIPTALFISNVIIGLSALSLVNIPMFSAFRRLTLLFVMVSEYVFLKITYPKSIIATIIIMTIGAFISAIDDVTFSKLGYMLVFLNNILTAGYLGSIKKAMKETNFDPLSLLYYTAILGFPFVALLLIITGELQHVIIAFRTQPELLSWRFLCSLILTATGAFAVNLSTSLCTHVTSPLTTSVAGQVKNVLQTVLGFFSWGFVPTVLNTVGLLVALGAQLLFAYFKFNNTKEEKQSGEELGPVLEAVKKF